MKAAQGDAILRVADLSVSFPDHRGDVNALSGVSFDIFPGEFVGMIGETGAGKSLTAGAALRTLPDGAEITGTVMFENRSLAELDERELRRIRGDAIGLVVQNPKGALDPMRTIGVQIARVCRAHQEISRREARERAMESLRSVQINDPSRVLSAYPHQLSGGMAQRVLLAMALVNEPQLLIADEPTTGLDVTVQADILDLLYSFVEERGMAVWCITHDLGVVASYANRAVVMFAGEIVESADVQSLFKNPQHPYTRGLVESLKTEAHGNRLSIGGGPPDLRHRAEGCQFAYRCPWRVDVCGIDHPEACFPSRAGMTLGVTWPLTGPFRNGW